MFISQNAPNTPKRPQHPIKRPQTPQHHLSNTLQNTPESPNTMSVGIGSLHRPFRKAISNNVILNKVVCQMCPIYNWTSTIFTWKLSSRSYEPTWRFSCQHETYSLEPTKIPLWRFLRSTCARACPHGQPWKLKSRGQSSGKMLMSAELYLQSIYWYGVYMAVPQKIACHIHAKISLSWYTFEFFIMINQYRHG